MGDEFAQKAARIEIKTMDALLSTKIHDLHVTLTMCVELYGHCVMCTAKAPLKGSETLVYGSDDAGRKIVCSSEPMKRLMNKLGDRFNLESHSVVCKESGKVFKLVGGVDVEGHKGLDGRLYVVDVARVLPSVPEARVKGGTSYLYCQFHPNFMMNMAPHKLSSDAFSPFG